MRDWQVYASIGLGLLQLNIFLNVLMGVNDRLIQLLLAGLLGISLTFSIMLIASSERLTEDLFVISRRFFIKSITPLVLPKLRSVMGSLLIISGTSVVLAVYGLFHGVFIALFTPFIPLVMVMLIVLWPLAVSFEHGRHIERELPYFVLATSVAEESGAGVQYLFEKLVSTKILRAIAKELAVVIRDSKMYFASLIDSMLHRARYTPSERFSRFLIGYASQIRSGGDVESWLRSWAIEESIRIEMSARAFAERVVMSLMQASLGIYSLVPLIFAALGSLSGPLSMLPVLATPALIFMAMTMSKADRPKVVSWVVGHVITVAVAVTLSILLGLSHSYTLLIGWCLGICTSLKAYAESRTIDKLRKLSFDIIKDCIDGLRRGIPILQTLKAIATEGKYGSGVSKVLSQFINYVELGIPPTNASVKIRAPFIFRYVLWLLGLIHEAGRVEFRTLHTVMEGLRKIMAIEESVRRVAWIFDGFALVVMAVSAWVAFSLTPIRGAMAQAGFEMQVETLKTLLVIAGYGYANISSTIRKGAPLLEPRHAMFIITALLTLLIV